MVRLVEESLDSGALGLSSSLGEGHLDGDHRPVPSSCASFPEFVALAAALRAHEGTTIEFIPTIGPIPEDRMELMADMSLAADRPLNWNLLGSLASEDIWEQQLRASDVAAARGAHVVALALPDMMRMRSNTLLPGLPGWQEVMSRDAVGRRAAAADPATRAALRAGAEKVASRAIGVLADFSMMEVADPWSKWVGWSLGDIAQARGTDVIDVLIDEVLPDDVTLCVVLPSLTPSLGRTDEGWAARVAVWKDPRVVLGGSDAGAHLDLMCHANYPTRVLGEVVRERGLLTLEEAVEMMTDRPARLYGLRGRGRLEVGCHADLVVFDPTTVASKPSELVADLPGGGERLVAGSVGVDHVLVSGIDVVTDGIATAARPGRVLRSGRDTDTVSLADVRPSRPVDDQGGPADGPGILRGEIGDGARHLDRVDDPAHGGGGSDEQRHVCAVWHPEIAEEPCVDRSRADCVDSHPRLGQLEGHRLGEHDDAPLRRAVGRVVGGGPQSGHRSHIDDAAGGFDQGRDRRLG